MKSSTNYCGLPKPNGGTGFKYPRLDELHRHLFGYEFLDAHDAAADTEACMRCFFELAQRKIVAFSLRPGAGSKPRIGKRAPLSYQVPSSANDDPKERHDQVNSEVATEALIRELNSLKRKLQKNEQRVFALSNKVGVLQEKLRVAKTASKATRRAISDRSPLGDSLAKCERPEALAGRPNLPSHETTLRRVQKQALGSAHHVSDHSRSSNSPRREGKPTLKDPATKLWRRFSLPRRGEAPERADSPLDDPIAFHASLAAEHFLTSRGIRSLRDLLEYSEAEIRLLIPEVEFRDIAEMVNSVSGKSNETLRVEAFEVRRKRLDSKFKLPKTEWGPPHKPAPIVTSPSPISTQSDIPPKSASSVGEHRPDLNERTKPISEGGFVAKWTCSRLTGVLKNEQTGVSYSPDQYEEQDDPMLGFEIQETAGRRVFVRWLDTKFID